ncbi:hypothetical protein [Kitasatospora sp. NPDC059599]|uniref:hypothetical protein n=1 Tax=Kitasatospora sp. NPDC059599 TaxID=3346880 RepID=UPI00369CB1DA
MWTEAETKLREKALASEETRLGDGDASQGESWPSSRTIRATVIRDLLTHPTTAMRITRLRLVGAHIEGELDLEAVALNATLELRHCHFADDINLDQATATAVYLERCHLANLSAVQLHTVNSLFVTASSCTTINLKEARIDKQLNLKHTVLRGYPAQAPDAATLAMNGIIVGASAFLNGMTVHGRTALSGAKVDGQLSFRGTTMTSSSTATCDLHTRCVLHARKLHVSGDVGCIGLTADQAVDFTGAAVGGSMLFGGATFHGQGEDAALDLARAQVKQHLYFTDGVTVNGMLMLGGATVDGDLEAGGGQFLHPVDTAIDARGLRVNDIKFATESAQREANRIGFRAEGKVVLADAVVRGNLDCGGGSISRPRANEDALDARGVKVTRDLLLNKGFTCTGRVTLEGAEIGGKAELSDGSFHNAGQTSVAAQQLTVRTSLLLQGAFEAEGLVDFSGAIVGDLRIGGQIHRPGQDALLLGGLKATQTVELNRGLTVEGTISLRAASIGGDLRIIRPNISRGRDEMALDLSGATVQGALRIKGDNPIGGAVDLRHASVGVLRDDPKVWPQNRTLLAEFTYNALWNVEKRPVNDRLNWLYVKDSYSAQTYEQLAAVYRAAGREDFARDVLYRGQKKRPRPGWRERFWSRILWAAVGYGYHPARVLYFLAGLEIFGTVYFGLARTDLRPSSALVSAYGESVGTDAKANGHFQPALYTLDLLLPVVSFGQRALWIPQGHTSWVATVLMVAGWILGAILVYGISTAYQRRV